MSAMIPIAAMPCAVMPPLASHPGPEKHTTRRAVVIVDNRPREPLDEHARVTLEYLGTRLAFLLGYDYLGHYQPAHQGRALYFVPRDTLLAEEARALNIRARQDLFGGVVPHAVLRTKAIAHPLLNTAAVAPPGWDAALGPALAPVTLPGYAAFGKRDARRAALTLLARGAVRLKAGAGVGGLGQWQVHDARELDAALADIRDDELASTGMVVEINLARTLTYGIGRIHLAEHCFSYCGTQRTTLNHAGERVYAGSDLCVVRGDFDALLALPGAPEVKHAIRQAQRFDAAVAATFPAMLVSRNNYDVILGCDCAGRPYSGVLEQSWRIGGASPAEIAAIEAFDANPARRLVRVSTMEHYGAIEPPHHARIHYSGVDPRVGQLTKFTLVDADEHPPAVVHHTG